MFHRNSPFTYLLTEKLKLKSIRKIGIENMKFFLENNIMKDLKQF